MPSRRLPFARSSHSDEKEGKDASKSGIESHSHNDATASGHRHPSTAALDFLHLGSKEKRPSSSGKPSSQSSFPPTPPKTMELTISMESPPCVFYGDAARSSGALLSGQLRLGLTQPTVTVSHVSLSLVSRASTKHPVQKDCLDCISQRTVLKSWSFVVENRVLSGDGETFPFSHLLPGSLPATASSSLGSIEYSLEARAATAWGDHIEFAHSLRVSRALWPVPEKQSLRVFPPTNIAANIIVTPHIHPIGEFLVQFRLNGVSERGKDVATRWRLRKLNWRIDEHLKMISQPCPKHAHKVGGERKGVLHEDMRSLGGEDIKAGWKTDYETPGGGQIELEFPASIKSERKPTCDVSNGAGLEVSHALMIELVVSEEHVKNKAPRQAVPTGVARVLRCHILLVVTERSGLGVSWDEEQPPMYDMVPRSPPGYSETVTDPSELNDLEQLGT